MSLLPKQTDEAELIKSPPQTQLPQEAASQPAHLGKAFSSLRNTWKCTSPPCSFNSFHSFIESTLHNELTYSVEILQKASER